jgi:hypothetical protein
VTGNRHFAKEDERRQRAALKDLLEAPPRLVRAYGVSLESAELAVRTHGVEMAEKLAAFVAENAHAIGLGDLSDAMRHFIAGTDVASIKCQLDAALRPPLPVVKERSR